jgi:hypothetical protein
MADFVIKKGNREPSISATLQLGSAAIDLTGSTVRFLMRKVGGTATKVAAAATVVSAADGTVRYDWGAADLDTVGEYLCEWEIAKAGGNKITVPNDSYLTLLVVEKLDA